MLLKTLKYELNSIFAANKYVLQLFFLYWWRVLSWNQLLVFGSWITEQCFFNLLFFSALLSWRVWHMHIDVISRIVARSARESHHMQERKKLCQIVLVAYKRSRCSCLVISGGSRTPMDL